MQYPCPVISSSNRGWGFYPELRIKLSSVSIRLWTKITNGFIGFYWQYTWRAVVSMAMYLYYMGNINPPAESVSICTSSNLILESKLNFRFKKFTAFLHFLNICLGLRHSRIRRISHHTALSFLLRHGWRIAKMTRIYNCIASFLKLFLKFLKFKREREREGERLPRRSRGGCVRLLGCIRP